MLHQGCVPMHMRSLSGEGPLGFLLGAWRFAHMALSLRELLEQACRRPPTWRGCACCFQTSRQPPSW